MEWEDDPNPYYNPEKFGMKQVGMIDFSSGYYEFDYRVVWKHKDGTYYTARDSGCSCPTPFEDYTKLDDLHIANISELIEEARTLAKSKYYEGHPVAEWIETLRGLTT